MRKTRFGIFMPPWNSPPTQNVTTSLQRNIETIQWIDALGYEEAWVGEHRSAGSEIIADPMVFLAHDWANREATLRHYELFARHVIPHFQPTMARLLQAEERSRASHAADLVKNAAAINAWLPPNQQLPSNA